MSERECDGLDWLHELQAQVGEWSAKNFGTEQPPEYPLIGAGEELGELTTSVLKQVQGIDDSEKYADRVGPDAERDAVGDIVIYLLDALYRVESDISVADGLARFDLLEWGTSVDTVHTDVDAILEIYRQYGQLSGSNINPSDSVQNRDTILDTIEFNSGCVVAGLRKFCEIRGYDFKQCVIDAWAEVSGREWDSDLTTT